MTSVYKKTIIICIVFSCVMIVLGFITSDAITVFSENAPVTDRSIVIIDAGHGGVDGGATSCSGVLESKTNLEIALKLRDVCNLLGIKTVMIRTDDISVYTSGETIAAKKVSDLKERVRIVNETDNCTLVSIHQNYFHDSRYAGAQVFYANSAQSKSLADSMQKAIIANLNKGNNRTIKKSEGVYLLDQINKTGILIECGFISNEEENARLQSKEYQQKLSVVIGSVLNLYLNT